MSGAVIKAGDSRLLAGGLSSLDLRDISRHAEGILEAARGEAEGIVTESRRQAEEEREGIREAARCQGRDEGHAEGLAEGRAAGLAEVRQQFAEEQAPLVSALEAMLEDFENRREQLYLAARRDVVVLAIAIARRICGKLDTMASFTSDGAVEACREALELAGEATRVEVRVHPADLQAVKRLTESLAAAVESSRHVRVLEDASVGRGGVELETVASKVDARVASRVERIADELVTDWRGRLEALSLRDQGMGDRG